MIARNEELVPHEIFHRSEMYQEYWKPRDQQDALRVTISVDEAGVNHQLGLVRPKSGSLFDATDIAQVHVLMPHLQRAVALRQRLDHVDMLGAAALKALDTVHHAILLLDQDRRPMHANAAGDTLLCKADGLGTSGLGASRGVLVAGTPAWTNRLHEALGRAAGTLGTPARASALRLPRPAAGGTLAVLVMPFHHEAPWSLSRRPAVLVCVTDPGAISAPPARQIAELFGLTGAEAALAADLLAGRSVREIAERRGRSVNTVRTQLALLMAKTEVNRQSELMRLLASLPQLPDPR
jgi:DNA-binding CsgD family transcriptional regulator